MKKDYYTDLIMGEWSHDKKESNKANLCYTRRAQVTLHKDFAMTWIDPADFKTYQVFGEVVLTEKKLVDMKTSNQSYFRGVELTDKSQKTLIKD